MKRYLRDVYKTSLIKNSIITIDSSSKIIALGILIFIYFLSLVIYFTFLNQIEFPENI